MKFPGCQMRLVAFYSAIKWNSPIVTIVPFVTNGYFFFVLLCSSTFVPLNYAKCVPFWIQLWRWHHLSLVLKRRWDSSSTQLQPTYSSLTFPTLNKEFTFKTSFYLWILSFIYRKRNCLIILDFREWFL